MQRRIHIFDNGIKVYDDHLIDKQRERYRKQNVHEAEEEGLFVKIIQTIPKNGCFVNIGSAIGYYPILAKKLSPSLSIYAVEPLEKFRRFFVENIALNELSPEDFQLIHEAVSSSQGFATFLNRDFDSHLQGQKKSGTSRAKIAIKRILALLGLSHSSMEKSTNVETVSLDMLIDKIGRPADLIQMDVQGFELDVLSGGLNSQRDGKIKTFLIGSHSSSLHQKCLAQLIDYGYTIEFDLYETEKQPDGIIVGSKGVKRL